MSEDALRQCLGPCFFAILALFDRTPEEDSIQLLKSALDCGLVNDPIAAGCTGINRRCFRPGAAMRALNHQTTDRQPAALRAGLFLENDNDGRARMRPDCKGDGGRELDWFETTDGAGYAKQ